MTYKPGEKLTIEAEYVKAVDYLDDVEFGSVEGAVLLIGGKSICIRADALSRVHQAPESHKLQGKIAHELYIRFGTGNEEWHFLSEAQALPFLGAADCILAIIQGEPK